MHNYLNMLLFTSKNNNFVQWVMCSDRPYTCTNLQIVSMECKMTTKSRMGVLLLVRIQWVRLLFGCKISLVNYGNVFQSAVQHSLYQHEGNYI